MLIFFGGSEKIAIPESRIYSVQQVGKKILVKYDTGEITWIDDKKFAPKLEILTFTFDSDLVASRVMYNFYKSLSEGKAAYFLGEYTYELEKTDEMEYELWF